MRGKEAVARLRFIKSAQRLGLRLREIAELQAVRAELTRAVERYPAAACHDPTATSRWCETAFAQEGR